MLLIDSSGDEDRVLEQPLAPRAPATELFVGKSISRLLRHPETQLLIGGIDQQRGEAVLFDATAQKRHDGVVRGFKGLRVGLLSFTPDFGRLIVRTEGDSDSGTFWLVDIIGRDVRQVGQAYPQVTPEDVGVTRMFAYKAADGMALEGVLTTPPGKATAKGLPVVILPHGGPIGVSDDVGFDWIAQAFASRGYAVFQPNYRGSGGYGQAFRTAGYGQWGRKMLSDIADGLDALAKAGVVDRRRACIVGASYGGYAALAGVTLQQGLYRCAVSYSGVSDLSAMRTRFSVLAGQRSEATRYWRAAIGDYGDMRELSPENKAARADAPILLIHGKDDTVVPVEQSRGMRAALDRAGKPVEYVELAGEDHWLSREESRLQMLKAAVGWVERHNPPD